VVQQAVQDRRRQHLVVEDLAPIGEALLAGDDQRAPLMTADQQPEKQAGFLAGER
jgi:hypothetical protein